MDLITTPAAQYTVPSGSVVYPASAWLGASRGIAEPVQLVQYDDTLPILAVALYLNGQPYALPEGAAVNIRMDKRDGHHVYNPALGMSEDRQTAYIGVTLQMTTGAGCFAPALEIVVDGKVAGTSNIPVVIAANQVPEDAVASTDELKTVQQLAAQAQAAADAAAASQTAAAGSASEAEKSASAAKTSETNAEESATNAANSASAAATSEGNAANSATSASGYASNAAQSASAAAANAQAAAKSAQEAQTAAQQALGFRTFFSAVSPDENGDLDPSRPMTTPTAQESWTIKSKGDRIQSVQVNGFTTQAGTGDPSPTNVREISTAGMKMMKVTFDGTDEGWGKSSNETADTFYRIDSSISPSSIVFCDGYENKTGRTLKSVYVDQYSQIIFTTTKYGTTTLDQWKADLKKNPITAYFVPADPAQAAGLYVPIQAQGHEYRCQMLALTEPLCDGDKVESNVPSGCDVEYTFTGTENFEARSQGSFNVFLFISGAPNSVPRSQLCNNYFGYSGGWNAIVNGSVQVVDNSIGFRDDRFSSAEEFKSHLASLYSAGTPVKIRYRSTAYAEADDLFVSLETHANGHTYAHDPVELVAVPYTDSDVTAAQQLVNTPSTLPYIDSADVPMLLDSIGMPEPDVEVQPDGTLDAENTQKAAEWVQETAQRLMAAPLASAPPVAGTYVVSSQDGTTVLVSLKAMQDGGDAATIGGQTLPAALLNLVYPVGSIYMSTNASSPQTFLGGTWQQIQGQFLLAASSSYPAGSTGGEASHTLTRAELPNEKIDVEVVFGGSSGSSYYSVQKVGMVSLPPNSADAAFTKPLGSGLAHNNMPPYLSVYVWKRTA